jgi:hypothetical protein
MMFAVQLSVDDIAILVEAIDRHSPSRRSAASRCRRVNSLHNSAQRFGTVSAIRRVSLRRWSSRHINSIRLGFVPFVDQAVAAFAAFPNAGLPESLVIAPLASVAAITWNRSRD